MKAFATKKETKWNEEILGSQGADLRRHDWNFDRDDDYY